MTSATLTQLSLIPRPHPQGGKRSGDFGRNAWLLDYVTGQIQYIIIVFLVYTL